jgi:hypothetical protein
MTNSNTVVVLPAFETAPQKNMTLAHQLADTAAMMNKGQLGRLVQKKLIYQFALYLFRQVRGWGSGEGPVCGAVGGPAGCVAEWRQARQQGGTAGGQTAGGTDSRRGRSRGGVQQRFQRQQQLVTQGAWALSNPLHAASARLSTVF